ncbi:Hypothetical protein SMAX5B_009568, partial [Scophthalmus maximus]
MAARLMACRSHSSPWCPLPPIGCDNAAWQVCQCHVISYFCSTTWTTRGHLAPGPPVSSRPGNCVFCSGRQK